MIPKFKYYFFPFLNNLLLKGNCRLYDLSRYIGMDLHLSETDLTECTKSGRVTKHSSRVNYCASYLKKMGLVESFSVGSYKITDKGKEVLEKYGKNLTLDSLRELPEFILTQANPKNRDLVYVKPHKRGTKIIGPYICNKKLLNDKNPNVESGKIDSIRTALTDMEKILEIGKSERRRQLYNEQNEI